MRQPPTSGRIKHPNHHPHGIKVVLKNHVCGGNAPLFSERLQRDGGDLKQEWVVDDRGYPLNYTTRQPEIREKRNQDGSLLIRLTRSIEVLNYAEEFAVSTVSTGKAPLSFRSKRRVGRIGPFEEDLCLPETEESWKASFATRTLSMSEYWWILTPPSRLQSLLPSGRHDGEHSRTNDCVSRF
jgi:hypothetical protein